MSKLSALGPGASHMLNKGSADIAWQLIIGGMSFSRLSAIIMFRK